MSDRKQFGLIGTGVMGQNLALNVSDHGFSVAVNDRDPAKAHQYVDEKCQDRDFIACDSYQELMNHLERPRRILVMVPAGKPVDAVIEGVLPYLEEGDLLIDGGNSFFLDTIRRTQHLESKGKGFLGMGVSGGEEGARYGPSMMPGGSKSAYDRVEPILTKIAAQADGAPCVTYIGPDGAGHFVKMVHNGIEYADMQVIAEAYFLLRNGLGLKPDEMAAVFDEWNRGELSSFLIEITSQICSRIDARTGQPMLDVILDKAGQKGTGKWTAEQALEMGIAAPTMTEAVFARAMSSLKDQRLQAAKVLRGPSGRSTGDRREFIQAVHDALFASKICCYAQGFAEMTIASEEYHWDLHLGPIAMIWRAGCIIRAQFLGRIKEAYDRNPHLANLMLDPYFTDALTRCQDNWRKVVVAATQLGIPIPAFSSALSYYDGYRQPVLPANLIQAQRDYFGAHTYERVDEPADRYFHTQWSDDNPVRSEPAGIYASGH